jgi:asparagine synthase (glutamine-hydrolysing)
LERDLDGVFAPYLSGDRPRLFLNRLTAVNIREKGAHLIQPKVERMLGAFGVTPLAPLFDERVIKFSFEMPPRFKLSRGVEKVILKRAYENVLPKEVVDRPKSGMRVPVHYWFRSEMRRYARRILSKRAVRRVGLFDADRVQQLLGYDIEEGRGRYGLRLWMLITFELWRRIVVEGEAP